MTSVSWAGAALAGFASFLSPCILPIVPGFMAFVTGASPADLRSMPRRERLMLIGPRSIAFALGLGSVFVVLGATATAIGRAASIWFDQLATLAGILLILLGLQMLDILRPPSLMRDWRLGERLRPQGPVGAFVVGLVFGFGWTPCVGPILAAILLAASQQDSATEGAKLLLAYAFGMGMPFVIVAAFLAEAASALKPIANHAWIAGRLAGAIMLATGILIATGWMGTAATFLYRTVPLFQTLG